MMNMKQISIILQTIILIGFASSLVSARRLTPNIFQENEEVTGPFSCVLLRLEVLLTEEGPEPETDETNNFLCWDEIEDTYWVPKGLDKKFFENESIESNVSILTLSSATKKKFNANRPNELEVNPGSLVSLEVRANPNLRGNKGKGNQQSRSLKQNTGVSQVLVVRIIITETNGTYQGTYEPDTDAATLAGDVFSDGVSLASQMDACTGGALTFIPASGQNIANGVTEVTITDIGFVPGPKDIGTDWGIVRDAVKAKVPNVTGLPENTWNHVLYIFPSEVPFGVSGRAFLNHHNTFYWDTHATLWVLMHEIAHNLGVRHAGLGGALGTDSLGDNSGYMGAGYAHREDDSPRQCYDAAKSFYFGWYSAGHTTIDTTVATSWSGSLVGIDDFLYSGNFDSTKHTSVLKIDRPDSEVDLYLMYNRAKGVNNETVMFPDKVTVMMQTAKNALSSELYAALSPGGVYRNNTWGDHELVIEACHQATTNNVDEMVVIVYFDDGVSNIACPTGSPTSMPSVSPTVLASESPSMSPAPSKSPTKAPTSSPSGTPTATPTPAPTPAATSACLAAAVGDSCMANEDCCSGLCSGGKPGTRTCLSNGQGPSPTDPPVDPPVDPPTDAPGGDGGGEPATCLAKGDTCSSTPCCNGCHPKTGTCK